MAASNKTDRSIGAVDIWHEGPEIYENMWQKVRSMVRILLIISRYLLGQLHSLYDQFCPTQWEYVFEHYADHYDVFHIGGDDHFVIPENLRWIVSTGNARGPWYHSQPLYLGGSLAQGPHRRYCGGGSGYTLNKEALEVLKSVWNEPNCFPHWRGPDEDILMAKCFRIKSLQCMDTNDEVDEARYHPWDAAYHAFWNHKQKANWIPRLLQQQGIAQKESMGQISVNSVSFHLKQPRPNPTLPDDGGMRFYYALLYNKC
jgi:glycoprotein-N-acetylgalactosamine 3-beta-galactosyltransferase